MKRHIWENSMNDPDPPATYPNPRGDNAWDNDAVHWLLEHADVSDAFDRHNLMECARRQPKRLEEDLDRVILAARLCERHGVQQVQVFDQRIGKTVWRLRRTDPEAPIYPTSDGANLNGAQMTVSHDDRDAARRLLDLIPEYEAELVASGKKGSTVFTYVDRAERFLRRVANDGM
jgi:hypothetical protein